MHPFSIQDILGLIWSSGGVYHLMMIRGFERFVYLYALIFLKTFYFLIKIKKKRNFKMINKIAGVKNYHNTLDLLAFI